MTFLLGTSGWQYKSWKEVFYPDTPQRVWLERYAAAFDTVEINNAFYRLPDAKTFQQWNERTPDSFVFAVKMSRYLTHIKRLSDPQEPVKRFMTHAEPLGKKLGPVLLQLPPNLQLDLDRLAGTLRQFPKSVRVAVEFRHQSWWTDETRALLEKHGAALCLADRRGPVSPIWQTADWGYMRFHDGSAQPATCYGKAAIQTWVERLGNAWPETSDVYVYFNNDPNACALFNAADFQRIAVTSGHSCTQAVALNRTKSAPISP